MIGRVADTGGAVSAGAGAASGEGMASPSNSIGGGGTSAILLSFNFSQIFTVGWIVRGNVQEQRKCRPLGWVGVAAAALAAGPRRL